MQVMTQSIELFKVDNLNFRGDELKVSFKGEYWNALELIEVKQVYSLAFVNEDSDLKSGDIVEVAANKGVNRGRCFFSKGFVSYLHLTDGL